MNLESFKSSLCLALKTTFLNLIRKDKATGRMSFQRNSLNFIFAIHLKVSSQKIILVKIKK